MRPTYMRNLLLSFAYLRSSLRTMSLALHARSPTPRTLSVEGLARVVGEIPVIPALLSLDGVSVILF
jgi:hypothetical protein